MDKYVYHLSGPTLRPITFRSRFDFPPSSSLMVCISSFFYFVYLVVFSIPENQVALNCKLILLPHKLHNSSNLMWIFFCIGLLFLFIYIFILVDCRCRCGTMLQVQVRYHAADAGAVPCCRCR